MTRGKTFLIHGTGKMFAASYTRVVIGGMGPYIEFDVEDIIHQLQTKPGEEYRTSGGKYMYVKYEWLMPVGFPEVKVYKQRRTVDYADYKVGKIYVSPEQLDWEGELYSENSTRVGINISGVYRK